MLNFIFNITGLTMFTWYSMGVRYLLCKNEPWLYNPINFITAFISGFFVIFSFFPYPQLNINSLIFFLAIFVLVRYSFFFVEDVFDLINSPTTNKLLYVVLYAIMIIYSSICLTRVV